MQQPDCEQYTVQQARAAPTRPLLCSYRPEATMELYSNARPGGGPGASSDVCTLLQNGFYHPQPRAERGSQQAHLVQRRRSGVSLPRDTVPRSAPAAAGPRPLAAPREQARPKPPRRRPACLAPDCWSSRLRLPPSPACCRRAACCKQQGRASEKSDTSGRSHQRGSLTGVARWT